MNSQVWWFATRSTGIAALVLLTASMVLGILTSSRYARPNLPRFVTMGLHRNVSLLVLVFLALHIVTTIADGFAPVSWTDAVLPFAGTYRPLWLGLGAMSFDLLIALTVTSLLRGRLGYRTWRWVHWTSYACWPIAVIHGLGTGTDGGTGLERSVRVLRDDDDDRRWGFDRLGAVVGTAALITRQRRTDEGDREVEPADRPARRVDRYAAGCVIGVPGRRTDGGGVGDRHTSHFDRRALHGELPDGCRRGTTAGLDRPGRQPCTRDPHGHTVWTGCGGAGPDLRHGLLRGGHPYRLSGAVLPPNLPLRRYRSEERRVG